MYINLKVQNGRRDKKDRDYEVRKEVALKKKRRSSRRRVVSSESNVG